VWATRQRSGEAVRPLLLPHRICSSRRPTLKGRRIWSADAPTRKHTTSRAQGTAHKQCERTEVQHLECLVADETAIKDDSGVAIAP
ncbi:MAG: hypothetical protein J7466_04500, partial [Roseiflexus sp.]|nr:hypothetical protein [Roseiflexus sp.]